jgi:hypothetical protein
MLRVVLQFSLRRRNIQGATKSGQVSTAPLRTGFFALFVLSIMPCLSMSALAQTFRCEPGYGLTSSGGYPHCRKCSGNTVSPYGDLCGKCPLGSVTNSAHTSCKYIVLRPRGERPSR